MNNKFKKAALVYAVGQILAKSLNFIFIPLYTNKLGTEGYGQLALIDMLYSLISVFIILGINSGYIRFYKENDSLGRKKLKGTAITFSIIFSIILILINSLLSPFYVNYFMHLQNGVSIMNLLLIRCATEQIAYLLIIDYSMNYKATNVVKIEILKLVLNLSLIIYFVAIANQGIYGMYKGYVISNILVLILLSFKNYSDIKFQINLSMLKDMLKYSCQLIPSGVSAIILNLADRYVLDFFLGLSVTGVYSLGYKFGTLIDPIFISPFKKVFTPFKFEVWDKPNANKNLNKWFYKYNLIGIIVIFLISIFGKSIIMITSPRSFLGAYKIIPLILISYFLYGKSEFYSLGIYVTNNTRFDGYIMILSGILNLILNFTLIPILGMYGATIATIISYYFTNKMFKKISDKCYKFKYNVNKDIIKLWILTITMYLLYFILTYYIVSLFYEIQLALIIFLIWFLIIYKLKIIKKEFIIKIINNIKNKVGANKNGNM